MNENAQRPYVVCHVFSSIDGRIEGPYMFDPAASAALGAYARLQGEIEADAVAYGSVTTKGFAGSKAPDLSGYANASIPESDYVAPHGESTYYVSLDPKGEIDWQDGTYRRAGRPDSHVVEVLAESTPEAYRALLRARGVSYVTAGSDAVEVPQALRKLRGLFGIERLMVCGGGVTDAAFLAAGCLDELSLVVAPVASGERDVATVFDESPFAAGGTYAFKLERVKRLDGDGLHLVYRRR